jgi:hypothetical protein
MDRTRLTTVKYKKIDHVCRDEHSEQAQCIDRENLLRAQVCRTGMMEIEALRINHKSKDKIRVIDGLTKERRQVHPALRGNG